MSATVDLMGGRIRVRTIQGLESQFVFQMCTEQTIEDVLTDVPTDITGYTFTASVKDDDGNDVAGTAEISDAETGFVTATFSGEITALLALGEHGVVVTYTASSVTRALLSGVLDVRNPQGNTDDV